jgi:hypothetical protein
VAPILSRVGASEKTGAVHDFLRRSGCDFAQGYLISRPIAREKFEDLMRSSEEGLLVLATPAP